MLIRRKTQVDKRERSGLTSHFLLGRGDTEANNLALTWVTVRPGSRQILHNHPEEQVYVVVAGHGMMQVGEERQAVQGGDLIYIPSNEMHGIENTSDEMLSYISAATPAFSMTLAEGYDKGQLTPEAYKS
jgi:mannose-6-phosphate isomerase-like protein (cupin superfamily)